MTTPEGKIKSRIKKLLNKYGAYTHMPVQNGMGAPSLDFVCCYRGLYIAIEAKAPGKKPTKRQQRTMEKIRNAHGYAFLVHDDETIELLERFLIIMGAMMDEEVSKVRKDKAAGAFKRK